MEVRDCLHENNFGGFLGLSFLLLFFTKIRFHFIFYESDRKCLRKEEVSLLHLVDFISWQFLSSFTFRLAASSYFILASI